MGNNSRTAVSTDLGLGLVGPEQTIVPLMASLYYSCHDPYAVKMAFHVGTDKPVEWTLARDLLAAALHSREGIGDVQAWPSAASTGGAAAGQKIMNISMTSPYGHAQFEASAAAIEMFLAQTYQLVPAGSESAYLDFDAELAAFLSEAQGQGDLLRHLLRLTTPYYAVPEAGGTGAARRSPRSPGGPQRGVHFQLVISGASSPCSRV